MRIVHVHKYFHSFDGASRYMQSLMKLEERAGHTVVPFAMHDPRNSPTPWSRYFVSALDTSHVGRGLGAFAQLRRAWWSREAERKMGKLLDDFRPDVVHVHNVYTHLSPSPLAACKARNIPVVMTVNDYGIVSANYGLWNGHDPIAPNRAGIWSTTRSRFIKHSALASFVLSTMFVLSRMRKTYADLVDVFVPCSHFVRDAMIAVGYPAEKIVVQHLFAEPFMVDDAYSAKRRGDFVLFAGRLESYKGAATLIAAVKGTNVNVKIAGTGPQEQELRKLAQGSLNIEFLGFVPSRPLWELMRQAQAVVVPSVWYEPFGLVAVEAMAQGTPVIVSDRGGLPEIVEDGVSGLVFKAGNAKSLKKQLDVLLGSPKKREKIGAAGRERAMAISNPQEHLAKILEIYSSLTAYPQERD